MRSSTSDDSVLPGARQVLRHHDPGNHAAVAVGEVAEVVVAAHLAAVDRVRLAHALLHERVAGLALHGPAAGRAHDLLRVPDDARVVHDRRAAVLFEERRREQADDVVAVDEAPLLVEEEAAVEVAVEGDADVGAREAHVARRHLAVLLEHRVRHAVREVAVGLVVDLREAERQQLLEQVDADRRAAVAAIADDRQRLQLGRVDVGQHVVAPGRLDVELDDRALLGRVDELAGLGELADVLQARCRR